MSLLKDLRLLLRFGKSLPSRNTLRIEDHIRRGARDGSFGDNSKEVARDIAGLVRSLAVRKELLDIWTGESESQSTRVTKRCVSVGYGVWVLEFGLCGYGVRVLRLRLGF